MSRWRVYKDHEDRWLRWIAVPEHENWWEKPQGRRFPEWGMAVNYADRMARTAKPEHYKRTTGTERLAKTLKELGYEQTTIKDPSGQFCDLTATVNERNHIRLKAGGSTFNLAPHEWKPLARFLLTEAYRPEET
ncbi:hypothetical protein J8244_09470 [Corynebacterium tuberculostearicum]|uniref:hypothetical protein n=1 Tax=Corynebacterium tuberculostearicum TaxID=38304 RepID=UPI0026668843|nr:hypothetical protein [Corynebacterium tuberculostearicum]WKE50350.1 hypothetical protein J8244_09470 [Corynebacterium tuberculostearicum]